MTKPKPKQPKTVTLERFAVFSGETILVGVDEADAKVMAGWCGGRSKIREVVITYTEELTRKATR